jgi:hypothetical protein
VLSGLTTAELQPSRVTVRLHHSFAKVGFVFFMLEKSAALISSVWILAEFQTAVYLRPTNTQSDTDRTSTQLPIQAGRKAKRNLLSSTV